MFKKVIIITILLLSVNQVFSIDEDAFHLGVSLGFFYTEQSLIESDSTIEAQVDSISLFMSNIKFGVLLRGEYIITPMLSLGLESGGVFNSYHLNLPLRLYGRIGGSRLNLKAIAGISYNRESGYNGYGLEFVDNTITADFGGRVELFHLYFELLKCIPLSDNIGNSTKISFGYSLFLPDIR